MSGPLSMTIKGPRHEIEAMLSTLGIAIEPMASIGVIGDRHFAVLRAAYEHSPTTGYWCGEVELVQLRPMTFPVLKSDPEEDKA